MVTGIGLFRIALSKMTDEQIMEAAKQIADEAKSRWAAHLSESPECKSRQKRIKRVRRRR